MFFKGPFFKFKRWLCSTRTDPTKTGPTAPVDVDSNNRAEACRQPHDAMMSHAFPVATGIGPNGVQRIDGQMTTKICLETICILKVIRVKYEIIITNPSAKLVGTSSFIQIHARLAPYNVRWHCNWWISLVPKWVLNGDSVVWADKHGPTYKSLNNDKWI